jgi:hypothetical protein
LAPLKYNQYQFRWAGFYKAFDSTPVFEYLVKLLWGSPWHPWMALAGLFYAVRGDYRADASSFRLILAPRGETGKQPRL